MTAAAVAEQGRLLAELLMTSVCVIRERGTGRTFDPNTGEDVATPGAVVYDGKCRVRPAGRESHELQSGGAEVFTFDYVVSVPFSVSGVREGHRLTVTASPDPDLPGVELEVRKVDRGEHITARRLVCAEVV